jgi:23S rRNA (uracil1939-C5)-methyltransferase
MSRKKTLPAGEHPAEIIDLDHEGRGVARVNGKATFIADALPGERVRFRYTRTSRDADEGQAVAVEQTSPDRLAPRCAHFGVCGGCTLQHLSPPAQIAFKQKQLIDALARIGKVTPAEVAPALTGPAWGYRRRARMGARLVPKKGGVLVGFRERESGWLAALDNCVVLDERVGQKLKTLGRMIEDAGLAREVPQIEVSCADHAALVLRVFNPPDEAARASLAATAAREGFELFLQTGGPDSVRPLTPPARVLEYSPDGSDLRLRFEPLDFIQVNDAMNQAIVRQAIDWLEIAPGERVLELFCGLGNFSLPLARAGARLTAVEGDSGLVQRARDNAARNGLDIRFEKADLFKADAESPWLAGPYEKLLLDPPRSGAREILPQALRSKPGRVVYVSCHPGTLARDAGALVHEHGYRLLRAGVMDMFPHTAHVESMALFEKD